MTFKQQRMIDKLKRYFDNEDEYNYKSVVSNALNDRNFEKAMQEIAMPVSTEKYRTSIVHDTRRYQQYFKYRPKGDDE